MTSYNEPAGDFTQITNWWKPYKGDRNDVSALKRGAKAIFKCPHCSLTQCIIDHSIMPGGFVFPQCICPNSRCNKVMNIRLLRFSVQDRVETTRTAPKKRRSTTFPEEDVNYANRFRFD